jgi:hypothetical protein
MRRCILGAIGCVLILAGIVQLARACGDYGTIRSRLADQAVSPDADVALRAIELLREEGPEGLQALLDRHAALLDEATPAGKAQKGRTEMRERLFAAIDSVAGQRDCRGSRLFWYTDLDKAAAAARAQRKPILSLRMMGKLTDEYSCANSRFFRTTLYANSDVSKILRDNYILHWESVRPVPRVTIDFGDGRKLERTLTGNSIHYVLTGDKRVIDALPGLYGPKAFLRGLEEARLAFDDASRVPASLHDAFFARYYRDRMTAIESNWASDLRQLGIELAGVPAPSGTGPSKAEVTAQQQANRQHGGNPPNAARAAVLAVGKSRVEMPILNQMDVAHRAPSGDELSEATPEDLWPKIAALHYADSELDAASRALIASKNPTAGRAADRAISKSVVESPLVRMFRSLQQSTALDTVRNEYLFRRQILEWLANEPPSAAVDVYALNERVYAELFLTPRADPWLGLMPDNTYTALDNNGVASALPPTAKGGTTTVSR